MTRLLLLAIIACGPAAPPANRSPNPSPDPPPNPAPKAPADRADLCESHDRDRCLDSTHCTLVHVSAAQYECRPEAGECELGLAQTDEAGCNARPNCRFEIAKCYCPCRGYGRTKVEDKSGPQCSCVCGGGKPSMCVLKSLDATPGTK